MQREDVGPILIADLQQITESTRHEQTHCFALVLQQGVGRLGRRVGDQHDLGGGDAGRFDGLLHGGGGAAAVGVNVGDAVSVGGGAVAGDLGEDGGLGTRNDIRIVSLERKLGIHASPTCVMAYGDNEGAFGELLGQENKGLNCMFVMMNNARLAVGLQGVAIAERAYQQALAYARDRLQSPPLRGGDTAVPIIRHPDVRRMLMTMKAETEAMRALAYRAGAALDVARRHPEPETRAAARRRVELLTPVVKAHCTDIGFEVASLGVQIHGGAGYIEETGAAQHLRDARIAMIYEGANGIRSEEHTSELQSH